MTRLAAADAQLFWLSAKTPNDQFLVYGFDGEPAAGALEQVRRRAEACGELTLRVADGPCWRYPRWVPAPVTDEHFAVHDESVGPAEGFTAVARLPQLDATRMAWRVHLFPAGVVVVQVSHALGDGTRSSALAAALLGRCRPLPPVAAPRPGNVFWRGFLAARAHRDLPPSAPPRPALSVNRSPAGTPVLRTLLVGRDRLQHPTVTVGALSAIGEALGGYLGARGEDVGRLGAEVPVSGPPTTQARNNFRNVGIGLYPETGRDERIRLISAELRAARQRGEHPATAAAARAFAATPAWLLRWGIGKFVPTRRSAAVIGNTVVSSVNRGPADLAFGGCPVRYTAGFPALSPMQSLTHGVHGIGDVVAISVHADPVVVDVADYLDRLAHALR